MTGRKGRIRLLFMWIGTEKALTVRDVWDIVGGFWSPLADMTALEKDGFLVSELSPGITIPAYPRLRYYRRTK